MGDSDDDYDRKRRDKFRGERAEVSSYRSSERSSRQPREEWSERESWSRPRAREYRPRDRYSPSMEPSTKRIRHDYYGSEPFYNHFTPYHQQQAPHREPAIAAQVPQQVEGQQPPMMSFKAFLATQDDNISDSEAIEKYNDYKLEFQRQQLNEFFVAHKDDEWFRLKYHPEDAVKRKAEQTASLKKRLEVFIDLLNGGKMEGTTVDCARTTDLLKLLDTVVVKLEGGTQEDLAALEQEYEEMEQKYRELKEKEAANEKAKEIKTAELNEKKEEGEIIDEVKVKVEKNDEDKEKEKNGDNEPQNNEEGQIEGETEEPKMPAQNEEIEKKDDEENTENKNDSTEDSQQKPDGEMEVGKDEVNKSPKESEPENNPEMKNGDEKPESKKEKKKRKRSYSNSSSSSSSSSSSDSETENEQKSEKKDAEPEVKEKDAEKPAEEDHIEIPDEPKPEKPKALHKTTSIFLRNLAPTITRQEVEAVCARYDGFLRVALADPQPERRWLRRGWVTFKRDANIKEICWNLNNIRLRECELGAIVNRDLSRRIRPVNGITAHKQVVRSDIRIAAKVTLHLDERAGLWDSEGEKKQKQQQGFGLVSNNPVLNNITDYLIEEASAEEEELLGIESSTESQDSVSTIERDETLIKVLDKILLYLRVVHSVDYYNHCEYPNEDEMPNRCGILHARGPPPTSKTDMTQFIGTPVETKMANFLPEKPKEDKDKNESKLISMALKDVDTEVDKFVQANTRELAKDKWLCPLSGKKFKGPDFVRKHIFNKHAEKIEEVKKEVEFFNNYLKDHKRPMLPEAPQPKREETPSYPQSFGPGYGGGGYNRPQPFYNQGFQPRTRGFVPRGRGGHADFGRPIIHYRDLDAPREPDEFI